MSLLIAKATVFSMEEKYPQSISETESHNINELRHSLFLGSRVLSTPSVCRIVSPTIEARIYENQRSKVASNFKQSTVEEPQSQPSHTAKKLFSFNI